MKRIQNKQSGQSLVELAVSVMIIMLLVLGAVETGMAIFQYVTISDAAQEGANYASIHPTQAEETDVTYRVYAAAYDVLPRLNTEGTVTITPNGARCEGISIIGVPNSIQVTVKYDHKIIFPLYPSAKPITLKASATNTILSPHCP
jgi:Flp pilus assembly protein TadG